jgi:hypothetical protein
MNFEKLIEAKQGNSSNTNNIDDTIININNTSNIDDTSNMNNNINNDTDLGTKMGIDSNSEQQNYTELDLNTKRVKLYLELLNDNHHYFINYNDCYNKGQVLLDLLETNNTQELKNTIKMKLTKYKKSKNITFETGIANIEIIDNKTSNKIDVIDLPYCLDLGEILDKYENKLNNLYINCQRKYDNLIKEPQNDEGELAEFRKMRAKLEKKINEFYTLQYVYNNIKKNRNTDNHYILHNAKDTYCASKGDTKFLLQLSNSSINSKSLAYLLETEVSILNSYNEILLDINNSKSYELSKETKEKIKDYIELKTSLGKNIKKLLNLKTVIKRGVLYIYESDMSNIHNSIIYNYIRTLTRHTKSKSSDNVDFVQYDNSISNDNSSINSN